MARPIKETPILFGSDGRRFEEHMHNPPDSYLYLVVNEFGEPQYLLRINFVE